MEEVLVSEERVLMGTQVIVKAAGPDRARLDEAVEAAFSEVDRLEKLMSHYMPESQLSRINQQAGKAPVPVDEELYRLIRRAHYFSELTEGAFDISFASVGKLWSFRKKTVPSEAAVKARLPFVNYKKIQLNDADHSVFLPSERMEIGLGGIGKGYAMDRAMSVLAAHGVQNAMVMAGGDTLIRGKKEGASWRVGLRDPDQADGILAVLPLTDQAISTSGDYERFFMKDGVRYHHILDTRTGFPAGKSRSVSILAPEATTSDALSTSVFVLGPKKGLMLIEKLEGVEGIIIDLEGRMHLSSGLMSLQADGQKK
ncbi:MAG: FAD:protein FMN transferase [Nitrospiria bacterium]